MITSRANDRVKRVRRLLTDKRYRSQEGVFVVEGSRWLGELARAGVQPTEIYCTPDWLTAADQAALLGPLAVSPVLVEPGVLASMSDTDTAPGVLAVVPIPSRPIPETADLLLVLDGLANPGNLGAILRTAAAAGVGGVLLSPGAVDPTNPKVVRGSMGALLRLPVQVAPWEAIAARLAGREVWLAASAAGTSYTAVDWRRPAALIIGSEAQGAGAEAERAATGRLTIPMADETESLNAAVAAGVILFEAARQRGGG
jgi:TrmH family RNA methyltransferase